MKKHPTRCQPDELLDYQLHLSNGGSFLEPILMAALVAALISLVGYWQNARSIRQDRQRRLFGEAYGAVMEYREYPFIVRRRSSDDELDEIVSRLSKVQSQLNKFIGILTIESKPIGDSYADLVQETRRIVGPQIAIGWDLPVRSPGSSMNVSDVDLSELVPADERFIKAVRDHLVLVPTVVLRRRSR